MDNNKIAFIICTNNELYKKECLHYISCLNIPERMTIEQITIQNATGICSAYNQAMRESNAKYKVYLHQDLFILNCSFISDILEIFQNSDIGMIGMAGTDKVGDFLSTHCWNQRNWYMNNIYTAGSEHGSVLDDGYAQVQAIDGMLMVTQYDLPWREDIYTRWHFYDWAHSMEFLKKGYKIVVPNPKEPWVFHDHGIISHEGYHYWKDVFLKENEVLLKEFL